MPAAQRYVDLLATLGVEWGLIGPREVDRIWERHLLNSLAVAPWTPRRALVIDVGSGAGLPGIPLALVRPDVIVTLAEPLLRRVRFLTRVVEDLDLGGSVRVVRTRAEDHRETYDVVTCRAVAPLPRLLGWTAHLLGQSGVLLALKGEGAARELAEAAPELRRHRLRGRVETVRVHPEAEDTRVLIVTRRSGR